MSLIKNSTWNVVGYIIPTLVAIPTMGLISRILGVEAFGIYTLFFAFFGYASIFDLGLSRAIIRHIALYSNNQEYQGRVYSTASMFILAISIICSVIIYLFASKIVSILSVSSNLLTETIDSLKYLSISIPALLLMQIGVGTLEGMQKFRLINIQKIFTSSIMCIGPFIFVYKMKSLDGAALGLCFARYINLLITVNSVIKSIKHIKICFYKEIAIDLVQFGGWVTVSNIISPLMSYLDRFILSNYFGATKVAYYSSPAELISRLSFIPGAVSRTIFPMLTAADKRSQVNDITRTSYKIVFFVTVIIVTLFFLFAEKILTTWLGGEYKGVPVTVLRILLFGYIFNSLAQIPFAKIQAAGYSKFTAIIHAAELLPYLTLLLVLMNIYGIEGVAVAWSARVMFDYILLELVSRKLSV